MCRKIENVTEYTVQNETGDARITIYHVFPGVEIAYISAHMDEFDLEFIDPKCRQNTAGIHFCREGRMEQEVDNEFLYLMPNDCLLIFQDKGEKKFKLPLKHYHGISIHIDIENAPSKFVEYLENDRVNPVRVVKQLCGEKGVAVLRSVTALKHIFSETCEVAEEYKNDYLKIKLLEAFFVLSRITMSECCHEECSIPRAQAELAKKAAEYISENLNDKLELKELTGMLGVSETYLQKSFRAVYGMPAASFIRVQKMQKAAQMLIHTNRSIDDIASQFGYVNGSKFSAVFKKIMGDSPSVYRKEHSKINIM